jgi:3-oxoacyl-[acyl-carrier protein] reductase
MKSSDKLTGKVAIVTGASKGIGASIAEHLAASGASVVVNYSSDQAGAERTVAQITAAGGNAVTVKANVAIPDEVEHLVAEAVKTFGKVDILVNNAGVYQFVPLEEITPEIFHRQYDINVLGLLLTTQAAVRHFPAEGGAVINISSIVSTLGLPGGAVYGGTKAAVDAVTRSLAKELGPRDIRVNSINPGMVTTEGTATAGIDDSDFQKATIVTTPLGRIGVPQDIATAAVFLASPDSSWITGETLFISGGYR